MLGTGYLLNLYKYPPADIASIGVNDELHNNISGQGEPVVRNVVWSNLDRIEVRRIDEFENYRCAMESEKTWIGERQFSMLYDLVEESRSKIVYSEKYDDQCRFRFQPAGDSDRSTLDKYRFFGVTMVNLSPAIHDCIYSDEQPGERIYDMLINILNQLKEQDSALFMKNDKLVYEVYGTFGSADAAIVWLTDQYTDVIAMLNALRMTKIDDSNFLVSNVYTMMGLTNPEAAEDVFRGSRGRFNLRLITRGGFDIKEYVENVLKKYISKIEKTEVVLGKYDVSILFRSEDIKRNIYSEGNPIHFRTKNYYQYILEAYTELLQNNENEQIAPIEYNVSGINPPQKSKITFSEIKEDIENAIQHSIFAEMPYLKETFWLLYQDYVKNVASIFSYPWTVDLQYSFKKSIKNMSDILENEKNLSKNELILYIQCYFRTIRQTILHISQAGKMYFEISNSQLKQTGAYSKILRAYYGIIKELLGIAYLIPKNGTQSEIIPFITLDVKPKAESEFIETFEVQNERVVNFELPYEALSDLPKYSKLLAHEIFHYIAPVDRAIRNFLFGCIIWTESLKSIYFKYFVSLYQLSSGKKVDYKKWEVLSGYLCRKIEKSIWNYVVINYDDLADLSSCTENGLWSEYFFKLDANLGNCLDKNSKLCQFADILFSILTDGIIDSFISDTADEEKEDAKDVLHIIGAEIHKKTYKDSFIRWIKSTDVLQHLGTKATDIIDAGREAFSDFFMIEVMEMTSKEYLDSTFKFVKTYEEPGEIGYMESFRIGMVLDYIWNKRPGDVDHDICDLLNSLNYSPQDLKLANTCWARYQEYVLPYRDVFRYLFNSIDFDNELMKDEMKCSDILLNFRQKVVKYSKTDNQNCDVVFQNNVRIIENMQSQSPLEAMYQVKHLNKTNKELSDELSALRSKLVMSACNTVEIPRIEALSRPATNLETIMESFRRISRRMGSHTYGGKKVIEPLWFRGHSNKDYILLPTLYRIKDAKHLAYKQPLHQVLEDLTASFRTHSYHAPEIVEGGNNTVLGCLISMQHYSIETNLLDWSKHIFSALYFALEKNITDPDAGTPRHNPQICILNPMRFNKAMSIMKESKESEESEEPNSQKKVSHYSIPALAGDDKVYERYLPFIGDGKKESDSLSDDYKDYPIAVYAPYVNPRIEAQSGCFVMFSIYAYGEKNGEDYSRFDLENLQKKYREDFNGEDFLEYIEIDKMYARDIANEIRSAGITKENIYPELSSIAEGVRNEIKQFYLETYKE